VPAEKDKYANLYSILTTVEVLEEAYANGDVKEDQESVHLASLSKQFGSVVQALNLSFEDVKRFADSAGLGCDYAIAALGKGAQTPSPLPSGGHDTQRRLQLAMKLGEAFVTLSDRCHYGGIALQFTDAVRAVRDLLKEIGIYPSEAGVTNYTNKWLDIFQGLKPNDQVDPEILERLKSEVTGWEASCKDAMR
jgi:hypothetical protein